MAISDEILPKAKQQTSFQKSHHQEGRRYLEMPESKVNREVKKWGIQLTETPVAEVQSPPPSNAGAWGKPLTSHDPNRAFNCLPAHTIVRQQQWTNLPATVPGLVIVLTTGRGASGGEGCLIHATANCHQHPTTT